MFTPVKLELSLLLTSAPQKPTIRRTTTSRCKILSTRLFRSIWPLQNSAQSVSYTYTVVMFPFFFDNQLRLARVSMWWWDKGIPMSGWFTTSHRRNWMALLPEWGPTFTVCVTALTISVPFESWKLIIYRLGDRLAWSARLYSHHFRFDAANFHNKILAKIG